MALGSNGAAFMRLMCMVLLVSSSFIIKVEGSKVRGKPSSAQDTKVENIQKTRGASVGRRILFGDKWRDPNNEERGGAAARAKGFQEVIVMRERVPAPAPTPTGTPTGTPPTEPTGTPPPEPTGTPNSEPTGTLAPEPTGTPATEPTGTPAPQSPQPTGTPAPQPTGSRNDECSNALGPIDVSQASAGVGGAIIYDDTTEGAQVPMVLPDRCNRISNSSPGVWYNVLGTGALMTASLCWAGTDFDTKITVYRGECNGVLNCVAVNDDANTACSVNRQASRVSWNSESGVTYHLLIHGFGAQVGDFQLSIQTQ